MQAISIKLFDSVEEAPSYRKPEHLGGQFLEAVVVLNGTEEGAPTVDLIFEDEQGQKYVAVTTLKLLRGIVDAGDARREALDAVRRSRH